MFDAGKNLRNLIRYYLCEAAWVEIFPALPLRHNYCLLKIVKEEICFGYEKCEGTSPEKNRLHQ